MSAAPEPIVQSMTGFGRSEVSGGAFSVSVEAKSVNHRHLDIGLRLPRSLLTFETDARRLIQSRLARGRVDVGVQLGPALGQAAQQIRVDEPLARQYLERARELGRVVGVEGDVTLTWLLERPGVVALEEQEPPDPATAWPLLAEALGRALDELVARRRAEGEALAGELRAQLADLRSRVTLIAERAPTATARREARLRERLGTLLGGVAMDESRILTEVAVWADRTDITEEVARLRAHLDEVARTLDRGGPLGRQLDFLIQELNREVNTAGAKADDLELSQAAIAAKGVLEKMREQAQNLE